jgi:5,10-methylenetetrahydromethanopterin reductase
VPSLRHPMVNAAAIAELVDQAPGRVAVAIGSGFTGRLTLGQRPMPWRQVAEYVRCLKALLAGETALWEGAKIRMLQLPGFGAERPIEVPILIGADGPKGLAVAAELGDGVFSAALPQPDAVGVTNWRALLSFGTVLDEGEDLNSPRVVDAAGPAAVVCITPAMSAAARPPSTHYRAGRHGVRRSRCTPKVSDISPSTPDI